jgi:hypothetical protein
MHTNGMHLRLLRLHPLFVLLGLAGTRAYSELLERTVSETRIIARPEPFTAAALDCLQRLESRVCAGGVQCQEGREGSAV